MFFKKINVNFICINLKPDLTELGTAKSQFVFAKSTLDMFILFFNETLSFDREPICPYWTYTGGTKITKRDFSHCEQLISAS